MAPKALNDRRILVVEDEFFLAEELCRELRSAGAVVVGPVPSVARALTMIAAKTPIDVALLDANLGGEMAYPVADELLARSVPFVFTSGYDDAILAQRYPHVPLCQKPSEFQAIARALTTALAK